MTGIPETGEAGEGVPSAPILLFDGSCGLCTRSVRWVLQREPSDGGLYFAPLDGPWGLAALHAQPALQDIDSLIWIESGALHPSKEETRPGRILIRSDAVIAVLRYVGGPWRIGAFLLERCPRFVRDLGYRWVARIRRRIPGLTRPCPLPSPHAQSRLLGKGSGSVGQPPDPPAPPGRRPPPPG